MSFKGWGMYTLYSLTDYWRYFHIITVRFICRCSHAHLYLKSDTDDDGKEVMGNASCVTRFISSLILLMEHGAKAHLRHLSEFFGLLFEFSRMGDEETVFLLRINVIKSVADFYLGNKTQDCVSTAWTKYFWIEVLYSMQNLLSKFVTIYV